MKYVMLMRHGRHEENRHAANLPTAKAKRPGPAKSARRRTLTGKGRDDVREVGDALDGLLTETTDEIGRPLIILHSVWSAPADEVRETVEALLACLADRGIDGKTRTELDPTQFKPMAETAVHEKMAAEALDVLKGTPTGAAILIVGHQPFLSWLSEALTGKALPIAHSELLCIAFDDDLRKKGRLDWVLTPSSTTDSAVAEIKEKIKYKMEMAKVLSVFITTALGFILSSMIDKAKVDYLGQHIYVFYVSVFWFVVAIALYLATLYAYDRLLMPSRFWGESRRAAARRPKWLVARPPSSSLWVLYQNMMHIWAVWFSSATAAVGLGLLCLAIAVLKPSLPAGAAIFAGAILGAGIIVRLYRDHGPHLGSED